MESQSYQLAKAKLSNPHWRLNHLYKITDKEGKEVDFRMNEAQERLYESLWYLNLILKARQRGFTTFIDLMILDQCLFNSNTQAGIIAHTLDDAKAIFRNKIKFPYENLPEQIRKQNPAVQDSANALSFANGSSIRVGTSLRSGTLQLLHISEHGKICARYPEKAKEIRAGALNTVATGQMIFIESTAEGRDGDFYEFSKSAKALKDAESTLTELDFKFHFFPWWEDDSYRLSPHHVVIDADNKQYFEELERDHGVVLDDFQKAWYVKKHDQQQDDMKKEYPSTPDEAFEIAIEGAYFARQMSQARREKRITAVPFDARLPVNTFWDLGMNDLNTLWLHQQHAGQNRFIAYHQNSGEGLSYYIEWLRKWGEGRDVVWGKHYGPHDLKVRELGNDAKTRWQSAKELGFHFEIVKRCERKQDGINASRLILPTCWFDEGECAQGIVHLEAYRREWNDTTGTWRDRPFHNDASHGADAFETFSRGYKDETSKPTKKPKPRQPARGAGAWMAA